MPRYALTEGIKSALRRGLRLHEEGKSGDGLKPATVRAASEGIESGWDLAKLNKAVAWFARHEASKTPGWDKRGDESPAFVAWLLWGGNPSAVERIRDRAERAEEMSAEQLELMPGREIQLFRLGGIYSPFTGKERLTVTDDLCMRLVESHAALGARVRIPIDLRHSSTSGEKHSDGNIPLGTIDPATLRHEPGVGLYATPTYTDRGRRIVEQSEGTFMVSPTFASESYDPRTGEKLPGGRLLAVALTEIPAQDGLDPVLLSVTTDAPDTGAQTEATEMSNQDNPTTDVLALEARAEAAEARSVELTAELEARDARIAELEAQGAEAQSQVEALSAKVDGLIESARVNERDALITDAVKTGKIAPAEAEFYSAAFDSMPEQTRQRLAAIEMGAAVPVNVQADPSQPVAEFADRNAVHAQTMTELNARREAGESVSYAQVQDDILNRHPDARALLETIR